MRPPKAKPERPLRQRALELLARREYSRAELSRRLAPHAASAAELGELLDALCSNSKQSDQRYAEVRAHTMSRKFGASRILYELKSKGIDAELAQRIVGESSSSELERAQQAWQRKFRASPSSREERARHMRFLQSRGFSFDIIRQVLSSDKESG